MEFPEIIPQLQKFDPTILNLHLKLETSVLIKGVKRQKWELTHEDVTLNKVLGAGAFGEVRSGEVVINKKKYECAVKIVSI